ncbi:sigma-70 family RNA polymerase sigma factor [Sorangium sp. So ce315]|uniref:sigma-70 family RNA polymerase sigma factor n=1 Tax=Sorangium sp. So ce315 TaxID=3133299 RepID=UPI003F5FD0C7
MSTTWDRAAFSAYRTELANYATLSPEAERELALRWRAGDRDSGRRLIEACLPFVMTIALEYRRWGLPMEDIVQEGNIGLLKAAERFDPDRGCRLATYAAYWIRAEIREHVARGYRIVRLGSSKSERRALRIYRKTHEKDPAVLAELSGLTEERATELLPLLMARDVSLERSPTEDGVAPVDRLASSTQTPEEEACDADEREQLSRALLQVVSELSPRERRIMNLRWLTDSPVTLEQLGADFGVSKERVRQIEERAKKRMRARIEEITREPTEPMPPMAKSA